MATDQNNDARLPAVAVLCCAPKSIYHKMAGVECYDLKRDVRTYRGGLPVVCHPPCRSWSAHCAHQAKPRSGEKELGPLCVQWLRRCGGVLEHPANSRLFDACGLPKPGQTAIDGLWTMEVFQAWWGYPMQKRTWLCFSGIEKSAVHFPLVLRTPGGDMRREQLMSHAQRSATPAALAEWLVSLADTVNLPHRKEAAE
jgi:hypothetical protein